MNKNFLHLMPRGKHQNQVFRVTEDTPSSRNAKAHPIKELDYNYPFFSFLFFFWARGAGVRTRSAVGTCSFFGGKDGASRENRV